MALHLPVCIELLVFYALVTLCTHHSSVQNCNSLVPKDATFILNNQFTM